MNNDMYDTIILYTSYNKKSLLINKYFYISLTKIYLIKINMLQKWWRKYKLPNCEPNPDLLTRKTLLRYYISKYELKWIRKFPRTAIRKLGIIVNNFDDIKYYHDSTSNIVTNMRNFCNKYMNKADFVYYGW